MKTAVQLPESGFGIASLVIAIGAVALGLFGIARVEVVVTSALIGAALGIVGKHHSNRSPTMARAGLRANLFVLIVAAVIVVVAGVMLGMT